MCQLVIGGTKGDFCSTGAPRLLSNPSRFWFRGVKIKR
jgi:hypothetical protein